MTYLLVCVGILYTLSLVMLIIGFRNVPFFSNELHPQKTKFSIVIPFRNEAENLQNLLKSIKNLKYPSHLFEVIFVDDNSEDNSVKIINQTLDKDFNSQNFKLIKNKRFSASPKKDAITTAIAISKFNWILTTDADCTLPATWLIAYDSFIQTNNANLIAGPIAYTANDSFLEQFQKLDSLSLQLVTIGSFGLQSPILCNGANLAYRKEAFYSVEGFSENNNIASGDDIFILNSIQKIVPSEVHFLKDEAAIVKTLPQKTWTELIDQRIRWSSKTTKQKSSASKILSFLVFLTNFLILAGFVYCFIRPYLSAYYLGFLTIKLLIDFYALRISNTFFKRKIHIVTFLLSSYCYPIIVALVVLGSFKGTYSWKGRKFEKQPKPL